MHERPPMTGGTPRNRGMADTVRRLSTQYCNDADTLQRVAAGIRALPDTEEIARLRRQFDEIVASLRDAGTEEVRRAC